MRSTLYTTTLGGPEPPSLLHTARVEARSTFVQLSRGAKRFVRLYGVLMSTRKLRLHVPRYDDQEALFMRCRRFRDLLNGKQLTCVLQPAASVQVDAVGARLKSCKILRCSSIDFYMDDELLYPKGLREIITSGSIVRDPYPSYSDFVGSFVPSLPDMSNSSFQNEYEEEFHTLVQHMLDYDFDAYRMQQKYLMKQAIAWNQLWAETRCNQTREQEDRENRKIIAALERDDILW